MQTNISSEAGVTKNVAKKHIRIRPKTKNGITLINKEALVTLYADKYYNNQLSSEDYYWILKNVTLLESHGWSYCDMLRCHTPDNKTLIYPNYSSMLIGVPLKISGNSLKKYKYFEYEGNLYCEESKIFVLNENGCSITIPNDAKKVYKNLVSRHNTVYTDFKTEFHNHAGAKRNWNPPIGQTFGIEIEMKFPTIISKLLFSRDVFNKYKGQWICERDGSLEDWGEAGECGLELISPPLLYLDLQEQATYLIKLAKNYGAELPDSDVKRFYGIHITAGTGKSPNIATGICALINHPKLRNFWSKLAGRDVNKVYNKNTGYYYCLFDDFSSTSSDAIYSQASANHYRATFIRNNHNVETRIFQTVFDTNTIALYIESIMLARNFAEKIKKPFDIYSEWCIFVEENGSSNFRKFTQSNI
jgi:hypothetical protein